MNQTHGSLIDRIDPHPHPGPLGPMSHLPEIPAPRADAHRGLTVWLTGLSGAGKTTLCEALYAELLHRRTRVEMLDGDEVRQHLSRGLGFSRADREENMRRIGYVARLLTRNNVVALVSAISPYRATRDELRNSIGSFMEVYVNAPLQTCEARDPKGLYRKARAGEISRMTGIDDPYEAPLSPDLECNTDRESIAQSTQKILHCLAQRLSW